MERLSVGTQALKRYSVIHHKKASGSSAGCSLQRRTVLKVCGSKKKLLVESELKALRYQN
jgi:hypothetical protein